MRALLLSLAASTCVLVPPLLPAQEAPPVPVGTRVRVTMDPPPGVERLQYVGRITAWDDVGFRVDDEKLGDARVYLSEMQALERSLGRKNRTWLGALLGGLTGAAIGLGVAAIAAEDCESPSGTGECGLAYLWIPPAGLLLGGLGGGIVGSRSSRETWEPIPPGDLPTPDRDLVAARP